MATAFPVVTPANGVAAATAMVDTLIAAGYTPNSALDLDGISYAAIANMLQALPSTAIKYYTASVAPGNVAANTTDDTDVTYTGVLATDRLIGWQTAAALDSGVVIGDVRVKAADTVTVRVANVTVGAINPVTAFTLAIWVIPDPVP